MKPMIHAKAEKYPGAYVFPPDKGMSPDITRLKALKESPNKEEAIANFARDRPVSCLDFASLYPSLIMTYNLSPEKIITTKEEYELIKIQYKLHEIDFEIGNKRIQAWSIIHENKTENMGLFPIILQNLFTKRKEMKGLLKKCNDKKELYDLILSKESTNYSKNISDIINNFNDEILELSKEISFIPPGSTLEEELDVRNKRIKNIGELISIIKTFNNDTIHQDYANICFERSCIDKKQGALKIYMNTFYGETGNHLSPFFMLQLAGGVTSAGQVNIKLAANYAKEKGFGIKYGDSVMPYTPILLKSNDNCIKVITIESIAGDWISYPEFKIEDNDRYNKEYLLVDSQIWTQFGWSDIKKVIRHNTIKKIYRIVTSTGLIDVTEDHSLLTNLSEIIRPGDCNIGTKLLYCRPDVHYISDILTTSCINQLDAQKSYLTLQSRGYYVSLRYTNYDETYRNGFYTLQNSEYEISQFDQIKHIYIIYEEYNGYVYDIETEFGTFHAGIGNIIIKNTDSLYLTCPNKYFRECDEKYISDEYSKRDFYTAMVKISLRVIANFEHEINEYLEQNNGTKFLKMENEGCNFPCLFLGKKKYFGIQHLNDVNFEPKKLYIKGIEVIKQGKSGLEKEIGNTIMRLAVSLDNELDIFDIVKNILNDSVTANRWKFEDFIQTSSWKPTKDNKSVQCFMKRMSARHAIELKENENLIQQGKEPKELLYTPLDPGERFSYILAKNDILYDLQGRKINIKAGDIMEYAHIAKKENIQIDVVYYLIHYVIGICARFISSNEQFMPPEPKMMDDKKLDEYTIKMAKKMLEDYIKNISGISKKDIIEKGKECKTLFKNALHICTEHMTPTVKLITSGPLLKIAFADEDESKADIIFKHAIKQSCIIYKKMYKTYCRDLCIIYNIDPETGNDINTSHANNLYKLINIEKTINNSYLGQVEYDLRKRISELQLEDLSIKYKTDIMYIVNKLKHDEEIEIPLYDLNNFTRVWYEIVGLELYKLQINSFMEYINEIKYKRTKTSKPPSKKEIKKIVDEIVPKR